MKKAILSEKTIQNLEEKIPEIVKDLAKQAQLKALASGSSVVISDGGNLLEIFPDGLVKKIGRVEEKIAIKKHKKLKI